MKQQMSIKTVAAAAVLVAMNIILSRVFAINVGPTLRITISTTPIFLAGLWFGPLTGAVCGAIVGGLAVIGWRYGTVEPDYSAKGLCVIKREQFISEFCRRNGGFTCPELMGVDIRENEGNTKAYADGLFENLCPRLCMDAIEIARGLI